MTYTDFHRAYPTDLLHRMTALVAVTVITSVAQLYPTQAVLADSKVRPNIVLIMADDK